MIILSKFDSLKEFLEHKAIRFCEKYGIIDCEIKAHFLTWEESYRNEGRFIHTLNLITMEEKSKQI